MKLQDKVIVFKGRKVALGTVGKIVEIAEPQTFGTTNPKVSQAVKLALTDRTNEIGELIDCVWTYMENITQVKE